MTQDDDPQLLITKYVGDASRTYDIAREAFEQGISFFKKELKANQVQKDWIDDQTSQNDAFLAAETARLKYEGSQAEQGAVAKWASQLPDQIMRYSSVIDVFVSSHPEYAALAWGAIKFVLMGVIDHARLFAKIAEALPLIGESLERAELYSKLYSKAVILPTLARLYAHVLRFLQKAVKWYTSSRWSRALKSVPEPYEIGYKNHEIKFCTASLDSVAESAAKVELRGLTVSQRAMDKRLLNVQDEFVKFIAHLARVEDRIKSLALLSAEHRDLTGQIFLDVGDNTERLWDLQLTDILHELDPFDAAVKHLDMRRAVSKRRQSWKGAGQESIRIANTVRQWGTSKESSLLVAQGSSGGEAKLKDLAVSLVDYACAAGADVTWTLSDSGSSRPPTSDSTLLWKALISQILKQNVEILGRNDIRLCASQFKARHVENEWLSLFTQLICKIQTSVVVVEAGDLFEHFAHDTDWIKNFVTMFQQVINMAAAQGSVVKIAIMSYSSDRKMLASLKGPDDRVLTTFVTRRAPVNKRSKRNARKLDRRAPHTPFFNRTTQPTIKTHVSPSTPP